MLLHCRQRTLDLSTPAVMGILNVTPDSFSDGGRFNTLEAAIRQADQMVSEGARILDVGGESTRPGAEPVSAAEECQRVLPVIREIRGRFDVVISIDTRHAEVAEAAVHAGADLINDVTGMRSLDMLDVAARSSAAVCVMHMQGEPQTMQANPQYVDVVQDVRHFLAEQLNNCEQHGIARSRLVVDPGLGFGKRLEHNLDLLAHLDRLVELGVPVLVGASRKSMFKSLLGRELHERVAGGVAVACAAVLAGAAIIRTHDVAATLDAVKVGSALRRARASVE